jgi:UDP-3-O-[3-hydroxymyristoyl] glucosamine N-acyltransferase
MESFFKNHGPFKLDYLLKKLFFLVKKKYKNSIINNISTLEEAKTNDISFFENVKYKDLVNKSKASNIILREEHLGFVDNKNAQLIISKNPLIDFILLAKTFYPDASQDENDIKLSKKYFDFLEKKTVIDDRVKIGKKFSIGPNSTIKKNVIIGNNVTIGSNCVISNAIIEDNVIINDGTIIGKIGFGFKHINKKIFFIPHIGCVKIKNSCYIGSNCTIDRGSFTNTEIGSGTMIDNQVHIAHNCKIGNSCFIAGQVGIAGSSIIGDYTMIGGQAGISGHLKIGKNVNIGGGSGVLKNVKDGERIMGYPANNIKTFIKRMGKLND